jgi:glutamate--cysteine ligase
MLDKLLQAGSAHDWLSMRHGLERENLRLDPQQHLSQRSHTEALGVSPNDPTFTLDFAESQLEIVTPPHEDIASLLNQLQDLTKIAAKKIAPETLWPESMPPFFHVDEIKLARFGDRPTDQQKHLYRKGLCYRYGRMMQVICGLHYNISFQASFWQAYRKLYPSDLNDHELQNQVYFKMMRQFLRHYPVLILLFGASPTCFAPSLKPGINTDFLITQDQRFYYGPHATSLRLSELGYHNPAVPELQVQYDSLEAYTSSLHRATHTLYPPYANIPAEGQLNAHYLQIENEYYAPIRPKPHPGMPHLPLTEQLQTGGVNYLEIRIFDLNPLLPLGIDAHTLHFTDLFMLYMALSDEANPLNLHQSKSDALKMAKFGLQPENRESARPILKKLNILAETLGSKIHQESVSIQLDKINHPEHLPAQRILDNRI